MTLAWVPAPPAQDALLFTVAYDRNKLLPEEKLGVKARLTWKRPDVAGMVMASLPVPPGFQPEPDSLNRLVSSRRIARWSRGRREVTFYLDGLVSGRALELAFDLVAQHPAKVRAPAGQAWLYYRPEVRAESRASAAWKAHFTPAASYHEEDPTVLTVLTARRGEAGQETEPVVEKVASVAFQ